MNKMKLEMLSGFFLNKLFLVNFKCQVTLLIQKSLFRWALISAWLHTTIMPSFSRQRQEELEFEAWLQRESAFETKPKVTQNQTEPNQCRQKTKQNRTQVYACLIIPHSLIILEYLLQHFRLTPGTGNITVVLPFYFKWTWDLLFQQEVCEGQPDRLLSLSGKKITTLP